MIMPSTLKCLVGLIASALTLTFAAPPHPHIVVIVADDLGRNDLGIRNAHASGPRTITPAIDQLIKEGITLSSYHTFSG